MGEYRVQGGAPPDGVRLGATLSEDRPEPILVVGDERPEAGKQALVGRPGIVGHRQVVVGEGELAAPEQEEVDPAEQEVGR